MGCCNSKKKQTKKAVTQFADSPAPAMSPTESMRADHHYPESLQSYEPGNEAEEQIRQERERLRQGLDMKLATGSNSKEPKQVNHKNAEKSSSSSGRSISVDRSSSGPSPHGEPQSTSEQASSQSMGVPSSKPALPRMPQNMQDQIKSKSSTLQSQRLESCEGETPIVVNATLYHAKNSKGQRDSVPRPPSLMMASQPQPSAQGATISNDSAHVPRLLSFEKPRSLPFPRAAPPRKASVTRPPFGSMTNLQSGPFAGNQAKPAAFGGGPIPKPQSFGSNTGGVPHQSSLTQPASGTPTFPAVQANATPLPISNATESQRGSISATAPSQQNRPAFGGSQQPGLPAPGQQNQLPPPNRAPFGAKHN